MGTDATEAKKIDDGRLATPSTSVEGVARNKSVIAKKEEGERRAILTLDVEQVLLEKTRFARRPKTRVIVPRRGIGDTVTPRQIQLCTTSLVHTLQKRRYVVVTLRYFCRRTRIGISRNAP